MRHDEVMICTQRGIFYATEHMQYVDGRMEFRTNFNIIHGACGGELSSEVIWQWRSWRIQIIPM
ncbi:MAG: hypothetical protein EGR48_07560 [Lachnospiraceae bacterium]|nr:hypothetical protein [Lachnospiraceae bacterium]